MSQPYASLAEARELLERNGHAGLAEDVATPADLVTAADLIGDHVTYDDDEGRELTARLRATALSLTRS